MSFSVSFSACSIQSARRKLDQAHAPASVKVLIEKALDAMPLHVQATVAQETNVKTITAKASEPAPVFFGVLVEASGHISDPWDSWKHSNVTIKVLPLFD